jgi:hypothetical protein
MEYKDIWNDICFHISDKSKNVSEHDFQIIAESLFEKLGWLQHKGEIITQKSIPVGSSNSVKPDIVIKNNGQTLFVVELKKPNITMSGRNVEQLFSYMRLLKLNSGILLGETLQVYYELPNDNKPPVQINDIGFNKDSEEGIHIIKLLSKDCFSDDEFGKYCVGKINNKEEYEKAQKYINLLCSENGSEIILNLLKEKLLLEFPGDIVSTIINNINIHILRKGVTLPLSQSPSIKESISKDEAMRICELNGLSLNGRVTFSSLNRGPNTYWANPNVNVLSQNWWLLLNDTKDCKLHVLNITANSIKISQLKVRNDAPGKIDLQIRFDDRSFRDSRSGLEFEKWFIKTISYGNG